MTKTVKVHISEINHGDTVMINGQMETVSKNDIVSDILGCRYKGNPYRETNGMLEVVLFPKWLKGEIIDYRKQI